MSFLRSMLLFVCLLAQQAPASARVADDPGQACGMACCAAAQACPCLDAPAEDPGEPSPAQAPATRSLDKAQFVLLATGPGLSSNHRQRPAQAVPGWTASMPPASRDTPLPVLFCTFLN